MTSTATATTTTATNNNNNNNKCSPSSATDVANWKTTMQKSRQAALHQLQDMLLTLNSTHQLLHSCELIKPKLKRKNVTHLRENWRIIFTNCSENWVLWACLLFAFFLSSKITTLIVWFDQRIQNRQSWTYKRSNTSRGYEVTVKCLSKGIQICMYVFIYLFIYL